MRVGAYSNQIFSILCLGVHYFTEESQEAGVVKKNSILWHNENSAHLVGENEKLISVKFWLKIPC